MSQSSRQQLASIYRPIRDVRLNRSSPATKDTSLLKEFCDTVRRLLQHIVFIPLLTLRLYMLPLLYISHRLAASDDSWHPTTWNFLPRAGRTLARYARLDKRDRNVPLLETWRNIRDCIFTTVRIVRALYSLGKLIGEDPNVLQPDPVPLLDAPDSAIDVQSQRERDSKVFEGDFADSQLEGTGSASQIYHAALLNGSTLDDILAAFERNKKTTPNQNIQALVRHGALEPTESRTNDQQTSPDMPEGDRYRTASIQTTPERMLLPGKSVASHPSSAQQEDKEKVEDELKAPADEAEEAMSRIQVEDRRDGHSIGSSPHPSSCHHGHQNLARKTGERSAGSTTLKRCPTFVRRQTKAHLPERSLSGDQRTLAVLQERAVRSTPTLGVGSPTKRAKLQRKVRIYQDPGTDIEVLTDGTAVQAIT